MPAKSHTDAQFYREDLAAIHIEGYGFHWECAAPIVLEWFREYGVSGGLMTDLGCGGGEWVAQAVEAGYQTVGIDISPSMIRRAKAMSPTTEYICASFADAKLPDCDAVTSLGEPLNYLNSGRLIKQTIRNVYAALRNNGLFVFDVRHPPVRRVDPINHVSSGDDWFCHARIEEEPKKLTRYITTFRKIGDHFRRDHEIHRLKLYSRPQMFAWLRNAGFRVRRFPGYGSYQLAERQSVFVCRKP